MKNKTPLTEESLLELGFTKTHDFAVDEGVYWYYVMDIGDITLISTDNDTAKEEGWKVNIFDQYTPYFDTVEATQQLIVSLKGGQL